MQEYSSGCGCTSVPVRAGLPFYEMKYYFLQWSLLYSVAEDRDTPRFLTLPLNYSLSAHSQAGRSSKRQLFLLPGGLERHLKIKTCTVSDGL